MGADFQEAAPAKINLALHVRERMADGYHRLETIFAFARDGDRLSVAPAKDISLVIEGPFGNGLSDKDNLVIRAADALRNASGNTGGAALRLEKRLPIAAGIGGGSADAAAALRLLARLWGSEAPLEPIARDLGADVPACLFGRTVRGEGRGEPRDADDGGHHPVGAHAGRLDDRLRTGRSLDARALERLTQLAEQGGLRDHRHSRAPPERLFGELADIAARGEGKDLHLRRPVARGLIQKVQGGDAHRTGGAQHHDASQGAHAASPAPTIRATMATARMANISPSTRSRMPP